MDTRYGVEETRDMLIASNLKVLVSHLVSSLSNFYFTCFLVAFHILEISSIASVCNISLYLFYYHIYNYITFVTIY